MPLPEKPLTRTEQYLSNIAGENRAIPAKPFTRIEQYLDYIAKNGGGGGGGEGSVTIDPVPTQGSQNAVSSGGVYDRLTELSASDISANGTGSKTVTGKPIVIEDADEGYAESLVLDLEPVQDLHGYTKPWAGGAGKNLLPLILSNIKAINTEGTWNGNAYTRNGITFTINTDSSGNITGITANGTANGSGNNTFWIISYNNLISFDKDVILNGVPSGSTSSTYYIGGSYIGTMTSSVTKTAGSEFSVALSIVSGVTVSNIVFKPMIRLATEADATFEPYSNICPIYPANGRNLLPLTIENLIESNQGVTWNDNSCVINGVTFTAQNDLNGNIIGILANGTATRDATISIIVDSNLSGDYYFTGCPFGGGNTSYDVFSWDSTSNARTKKWDKSSQSSSDTNNSLQQINIVSGHIVRINCRVFANAVVSNLLFTPMVLSVSANPTFIPYQAVGVKRVGKNLLNTSKMSTNTANGVTFSRSSDGIITVGGQATQTLYRVIGSIQTKKGISYIITGTPSGAGTSKYRMTVGGYGYDYGEGYTFVGDGESHNISVDIYTGYPASGTLVFKPMIRIASIEDDTFDPYQLASLTLSLGQDVYGGRYDVGSGELTITHTFVKMADQTIVRRSTNTTNIYRGSFRPTLPVKQSDNPYVISNALQSCTSYETFTAPRKEYSIGGDVSDNYINFFASDIQTIEEWQTFATENDVQICYELATPITVSLTPQQLSLLQAYNLITSDDDGVTSIDLTYIGTQTSNVQERLDESSELGQNIISSIAPAETGISSTNYSVGDYLMLNGVFCKVTSAIATGETITVGTNVTATTVAAELLSIISQLS